MRGRDAQLGRLADDRRVGATRSSTARRAYRRAPRWPPRCRGRRRAARAPLRRAQRPSPRRRALHVERAAAVEPPVVDPAVNRSSITSTPTVSTCPFSFSEQPPSLPRAIADLPTVARRPALRSRPRVSQSRSQPATNAAISARPRAPGTSAGFTESIATSADASSVVASLRAARGCARRARRRSSRCRRRRRDRHAGRHLHDREQRVEPVEHAHRRAQRHADHRQLGVRGDDARAARPRGRRRRSAPAARARRAVRAYSATASGVRCAERTSNSHAMPRASSSSSAACIRSRSDSEPTRMPTTARSRPRS